MALSHRSRWQAFADGVREYRSELLFVIGVSGIVWQLIVYGLGGPVPNREAVIVLGIFALGVPAAESLIRAWRGSRDRDRDGG